jgi:hypothetical protein
MKIIRKVVQLTGRVLNITLPESYSGAEVEVTVRTVVSNPLVVTEGPRADYETLYGSLKLGKSVEEIQEQLKKLRREWDRDIS